MPMMGNLLAEAMARFWVRPAAPQSTAWSLASVATVMEALRSAVMAVAGALKMKGLAWGSGQVAVSVMAVSRLTMRSSAPAKSWLTVVPSAVFGFWTKRVPTAPAKWTSPPKARVTGRPLPFQSGLRGEWWGKATTTWCVPPCEDVVGGFFPPPPPLKTT